jgi:hypothetical protein
VTNGGVIPPEVLPHLFDPFRGGKRDSSRGDGFSKLCTLMEARSRSSRGARRKRLSASPFRDRPYTVSRA